MSHRNEITAKVVSIQASNSLNNLIDLNTDNLADGGMIIYDEDATSYVVTSELEDEALTISGGDYILGKGTTIRITAATNSDDPDTLAFGELAYNDFSDTLFIGSIDGVVKIAGDAYVNMLSHTPGTSTPDAAVILDSDLHTDTIKTSSFVIDVSGGVVTPITSIETVITDAATDAQFTTALATENRIHEVVGADTHKTLANNSGALRNLSDVITTHGNGNTLILDDVQAGDGITLDSSDLGLEYAIVNISTEQLIISPGAGGSLSFAGGTGTVPLGARILASGGVASVLRTTVAGNPHWVIFGNGLS